jgi:hypothetical protein
MMFLAFEIAIATMDDGMADALHTKSSETLKNWRQ